MHPIPVLHMTIGEYSQMINGALVEKWNQLQVNYYSLSPIITEKCNTACL
jgi:hypothetical protein